MATIRQAVGIRNGVNMMPNLMDDINTVTRLLDRIPAAQGGMGAWGTRPDRGVRTQRR